MARLPDGQRAYIPFTLPGEAVTARPTRRRGDAWTAEPLAIDRPSAARATPPCRHFGRCGGCALQHWQPAPAALWKAERVAAALARAGFSWTPRPAIAVPAASRRRMDLALRRFPDGVRIGLHAGGSPDIVAIDGCQVLHPELLAILPPLRATLDRLSGLRREGSALLNLLDSGPDLLLRHDAELTAQDRQRLAAFAAAHRIPRIAVSRASGSDSEIACQLGPVSIAFAGVAVAPPPGAFLQASREGEAAIVAAVLAGLPDRPTAKARVVELYAGCGTLTFPLSRRVRVSAFEGDPAALLALAGAARAAGRVTPVRRDLVRQPLSTAELAGFSAVILDPPFGGAAAQMGALAAAAVPRIVYVSCNPAALARDAAVLAGGGYRLRDAVAIDQFVWAPHVESVITFAR